jgi:hypothetical protein
MAGASKMYGSTNSRGGKAMTDTDATSRVEHACKGRIMTLTLSIRYSAPEKQIV